MRNNIILRIAWRNMLLHRMRSILTIVGFGVGAAAIVFLMGFGYGLQRLVTSQVSGGDAFSMIDIASANQEVVPLNSDSVDQMKQIDGVEGVAPQAGLSARTQLNNQSLDLAVVGITANYFNWYGDNVIKGNGQLSQNNIVVNTLMAQKLSENPNQAIGASIKADLVIAKELAKDNAPLSKTGVEYKVGGIVKDNNATPMIYADLGGLETIGVTRYSQARVKAITRQDIDSVRSKIENMGYKTDYIGDTVTQINDVFRVVKSILGSFGVIALLVAIIGMFNTLTISLMERIKEIALMKVLGIKPIAVTEMVMAEALIVGVLGAAAGIILGILAGLIADGIISAYAQRAGGEPASVFYFPAQLIIGIILAAAIVSLLTGIMPARRANHVNPLHVFRYE